MSRRRELIEQLDGISNTWTTGLLMQNMPIIMLENDYIRALCAMANATLLSCQIENEQVLHNFDISMNK